MSLIRVWRGTDGDTAPVPFECETWGYPHVTTTGETMYQNTHFRTEAEAWESIKRSVEAGVSMAGRKVIRAQEILREAEIMAAQMAADYVKAIDGFNEFQAKEPTA